MSDSDAAPPSPSSPSQSQHQARPFTAHWVTAAFTVILAIATLALVGTAIVQHFDTVEAIEATKRLAIASENAAADRRQTASAEFILKFDAMLAERRYDRIIDDIDSHDSNYQLPKYKNESDADVDDMGSFITEHLIGAKMAYEHFSYAIEKAWCNTTVQETIRKERAADKSKTEQSEPAYGDFEKLTKEYLEKDGPSCKDVEDAPVTAQRKKRTGDGNNCQLSAGRCLTLQWRRFPERVLCVKTCKRSIEMTPLCKIGVTLPRVLGSWARFVLLKR